MNKMNKLLLILGLSGLALASPATAHNGVIHEAPHGGIMRAISNADIEIVLAPKGGVRVYLNAPKGGPLPASAASEVSAEIDRKDQKTEYVTMAPDKTGTLWTGNSKPVSDPANVIRIGVVVQGVSGLIEVPRSKFPVYGKESGAGGGHAH